jgi:competence protein ComEA
VLLAVAILGSAVGLRSAAELTGRGPQRVAARPPVLRVDPSTAPAHVLEALPQIGPTMASRIVAERQVRPFASLDDLRRRVRGLGLATMAKLAPHLALEREPQPAISPATAVAVTTPNDQPLSRRRRRPSVR